MKQNTHYYYYYYYYYYYRNNICGNVIEEIPSL
jgi:hypothetical protein